MTARKSWLLRVTDIREQLEAMTVPVVDRAVFERLFGVRRRRAIQLMNFFGGFQSGRTFLIDRLDLIRQLDPIEASAEFVAEHRRRQRLIESLDELRRHRAVARVVIPVQPPAAKVAGLPEGVHLEPGCLQIEFQGAELLLSRLYALAQAAAADFDVFKAAVERSSPPPDPPSARSGQPGCQDFCGTLQQIPAHG